MPVPIHADALSSGAVLRAALETRAGGVRYLRNQDTLGAYPARLTDRLAHWAEVAPDRLMAAQRDAQGCWQGVTYAGLFDSARRVGAALLRRGLNVDRPVAILSGNSLTHLTLAIGAMWAGVPYASVSPAYSLVSRDFARLRHVIELLTPGLVWVDSAAAYADAINAAVPADVEVVQGENALPADPLPGRAVTPWLDLLSRPPDASQEAAHAATGPDTVVKFLFTSGSTRQPKAVTHTQRMLCSNQQMIRQGLPMLGGAPPVLVDWLPWNHTFGGNHNLGLVLYNGGTLYIDEGRPTPAGMAATVRNLKEVTPSIYFNVPKGFDELARVMERDALFRDGFLRGCRTLFYAGAALSQAVWDRLDRLALQATGERVSMVTGFGMTETSPSCTYAFGRDLRAGQIGLPCPGVEIKLAPLAGKIELRLRGPHVMPDYWRAPDLTRAAFDDEGFYRTGDAVKFVDDQAIERGLLFDGRLAEDFKLATGSFVSVGPLRARIVQAGAPYIADAVITGADRDEVGALLVPHPDACREFAGLPASASLGSVLSSPRLMQWLQELVDGLAAQASGSASRVMCAAWLVELPSLDHGEVTDKGSINQRAVLENRAALVNALYRQGEVDEEGAGVGDGAGERASVVRARAAAGTVLR